jgi:hypothetical protein
VPLPGTPCGSDDEVTAPSRLRDSWKLGFRWEPPAQPHWDGVRELADILVPVELDDLSPIDSDEELLAEHIRALAPGAELPATPLPPHPLLPLAGARAALDRLLTIWITEVRPTLAPDLIHPEGEAAVLLSTITVVPAQPFDSEAPAITDHQEPDDEGRPYLAPTQLIQELVLAGGGSPIFMGGGSPPDVGNLIKLATLTQTEVHDEGGSYELPVLWFHVDRQVVLADTVMISRDTEDPVPFEVRPRDFPRNTFTLFPQISNGGSPMEPDELLDLQLELTEVGVELADGSTVRLEEWLDREGVDVHGREGDVLPLHHTMSIPDDPPDPQPPRPVRKLVSAQPVFVDGEVPGIELWWHVDRSPFTDEERVVDLNSGMIRVVAEVEDRATPVELQFGMNRRQHNVDHLMLDQRVWGDEAGFSPYLRVLVSLEGLFLDQYGGDAVRYAEELGFMWEDAQEDGRVLVAWVRMFDFGNNR